MSNSNGIITAPVTMGDINKVLGISTRKLDVACRHDNINKWSKIKPVGAATNGERLTSFKGSNAENSAGIYYGLQAGSGYQWGTDIHNADWSYVNRPTGTIGVAPCRGLDFAGYDHYAKPTLSGRIILQEAGKVVYNRATPFEFILTWNMLNNTTGVDVFDCTHLSDNEVGNWYLCVMVDNFAAVLTDESGNILPISYYPSGDVKYKCHALPSGLQATATYRRVTFFLADLYSAKDESIRSMITGDWAVFAGDYKADVQMLSIPNAVNYQLEWVSTAVDYGAMTLGVTYSPVKMAFVVDIMFTTRPSVDRVYMLYFGLHGVSDTLAIEFTGGADKDESVIISDEELGVRLIDGETYTVVMRLFGYEDGSITPQALAAASGPIIIE